MSISVSTVAETPLWQKAAAQIQAQQDRERAFAERVRRDLLLYPGYFQAAVERLKELQAMHQGRPHWLWAMDRWTDLLAKGGLQAVLQLLEAPEEHQEMISTSPFATMRPPLPENSYYLRHASS